MSYGSKEDCDLELKMITQTHESSKKKRSGSGPVSQAKKSKQALDEEQNKLKSLLEERKEPAGSFSRHDADIALSLSDIVKRLDTIESKVDKLSDIIKCLRNTPSPMSREERGSPPSLPMEKCKIKQLQGVAEDDDDDHDVVDHDLVFNGIDLLALKAPPKEPTRYATRVAGVLFTFEELITGMLPPISERGKKTEFDREKVALLRRCIAKKYGEKVLQKYWTEIRRSVNQKGNDLRKKQKTEKNVDLVEQNLSTTDGAQED